MPRTFRRLIAPVVFVALAAGQAHASQLALKFDGLTVSGSSLPSGSLIDAGTHFEVQFLFPDVPVVGSTGIGSAEYLPTAVTAEIGGTVYVGSTPSDCAVNLYDPSSGAFGGLYLTFAGCVGGGFDLAYTTATPPLDATAPAPTVFSGYSGTLSYILALPTAEGTLLLGFDPTVGVDTSIVSSTATPEPASLYLALPGGIAGIILVRRRRAATSA
jgi:hypothetical protein